MSYILLESGLGSPTDIAIVKETTTALQSVFPPAELGSFLEFSRKDKEKHLHELSRIVSGIKLFNKTNGTGTSRGIEDLPAILNEAIQPAIDDITKERDSAQHTANLYTAILWKKDQEKNVDYDKEKVYHSLTLHYVVNDSNHTVIQLRRFGFPRKRPIASLI